MQETGWSCVSFQSLWILVPALQCPGCLQFKVPENSVDGVKEPTDEWRPNKGSKERENRGKAS
jgi:hypothetical protein